MNSGALLTAMLFGSAIAGTRLVARTPEAAPQDPQRQGSVAVTCQAKGAAADHADAAYGAQTPRCAGRGGNDVAFA